MEWELVKPWVNRMGIVLEFLSFWLAAPEILGEEWLRALERKFERGIRVVPSVVGMTGLLVMAMSIAVLVAVWEGWEKAAWVMAGCVLLVLVELALGDWKKTLAGVVVLVAAVSVLLAVVGWEVAAVFATGVLTMLAAVIRHVEIGVLVAVVLAALAVGLMMLMAELREAVWSLLRVIADDKRIRQRSLAAGAVLFVVGFLLQLIATF